MTKTWLITGCSTGFGRLLAQAALDRGDQVVATARDPATLADIAKAYPKTARTTALDVTKPGAAEKAVALTMDAFGRLDVLVNNAGFGFIGAIEEATPDEYRPMFETNIIGLLETTRAALPALRKTGAGGRIVNMSSGAGIKGLQGSGHYNATKFAVEGISEALAQEVAPFGIAVIIVEPGSVPNGLPWAVDLARQEGDAGICENGRRVPHFPRQQRRQAGRRPGQGRSGHPESCGIQRSRRCTCRSARALMRWRARRLRSSRRTSTPGRRWRRRPTTSETIRGRGVGLVR